MFTIFSAAVGSARTLAGLDDLCRDIYRAWGSGVLTDDEVASLTSDVEAKRKSTRSSDVVAVRALQVPRQIASAFVLRRPRRPRSKDRMASINRRRQLAFSGVMPPALAAGYTVSGLAVLRIVADAVRSKGQCDMTVGEIASRAGVGMTTARNTVRLAAGDGLLIVQERRRHARPSLSNLITIISREWLLWITRGRASEQRGSKKPESTDTRRSENYGNNPRDSVKEGLSEEEARSALQQPFDDRGRERRTLRACRSQGR